MKAINKTKSDVIHVNSIDPGRHWIILCNGTDVFLVTDSQSSGLWNIIDMEDTSIYRADLGKDELLEFLGVKIDQNWQVDVFDEQDEYLTCLIDAIKKKIGSI